MLGAVFGDKLLFEFSIRIRLITHSPIVVIIIALKGAREWKAERERKKNEQTKIKLNLSAVRLAK